MPSESQHLGRALHCQWSRGRRAHYVSDSDAAALMANQRSDRWSTQEEEVRLADHPDEVTNQVDDRKATDAIVSHQVLGIFDWSLNGRS